MAQALSPRLARIVDALPLRPGIRVLEIGCGPGAAAREIVRRVDGAFVLACDRSGRAIAAAERACAAEIAAGRMALRLVAAEEMALRPGEAPYDIAFAVRVGAFDGRHARAGRLALPRIGAMLTPQGRFFVDGGDPLREVPLK